MKLNTPMYPVHPTSKESVTMQYQHIMLPVATQTNNTNVGEEVVFAEHVFANGLHSLHSPPQTLVALDLRQWTVRACRRGRHHG